MFDSPERRKQQQQKRSTKDEIEESEPQKYAHQVSTETQSQKEKQVSVVRRTEHLKEFQFTSISQYYEYLVVSQNQNNQKEVSSFIKLPIYQSQSNPIVCFCGKQTKMRGLLIKHVESQHCKKFQSLEYWRAYHFLCQVKLKTSRFADDQDSYLAKLHKMPYQLLKLPEDLISAFPQELRSSQNLGIFLTNQLEKQNIFFIKTLSKLNFRRPFYFSENFMEVVRLIIIKYITLFARKQKICLNNLCLQDIAILLLAIFRTQFDRLRENEQKFKKRILVYSLSKLLECILWNFLDWVNKNYKKVFEVNGIAYPNVSLQKDEKYCETERLWKLDLFITEYLTFMKKYSVNDETWKIVNIYMKTLLQFAQIVKEKEVYVEFSEPHKKRKQ